MSVPSWDSLVEDHLLAKSKFAAVMCFSRFGDVLLQRGSLDFTPSQVLCYFDLELSDDFRQHSIEFLGRLQKAVTVKRDFLNLMG